MIFSNCLFRTDLVMLAVVASLATIIVLAGLLLVMQHHMIQPRSSRLQSMFGVDLCRCSIGGLHCAVIDVFLRAPSRGVLLVGI